MGGPAGAAYGFQLGLAVGTVVSPTQLPGTFGPRLSDNRTTTSQLGAPIVELWGTDAVAGTVIWLGDVVEHANTEEVGGKGGPEGENTTFTYTQSIAVGLCRGPQGGVRRIWENGKLVYDVREQLTGETVLDFTLRILASVEYGLSFELYLGDEDQLPDPTIELKEGLGNVPAYRGLMYIVYHDRLLRDDQGQRHPNFKFEVVSSPVVIPTPPDPDPFFVPLILYGQVVEHSGGLFGGYATAGFIGFGGPLGTFGSIGTADDVDAPLYWPTGPGGSSLCIHALYWTNTDTGKLNLFYEQNGTPHAPGAGTSPSGGFDLLSYVGTDNQLYVFHAALATDMGVALNSRWLTWTMPRDADGVIPGSRFGDGQVRLNFSPPNVPPL